MRELIDVRGDGYRPTDSNAEARFEQLMADVGIRSFERQVDVGDVDWLGRLDFRDRTTSLLVEIDSETFHASRIDQARDEQRRASLRAAGHVVLVIPTFDLWHRPGEVQDLVGRTRRSLHPAQPPPANLSRQRPQERRRRDENEVR